MDIQSSTLAETFKLFAVFVPGWVSPVNSPAPAHGGIPRSLYDDKPTGLQVVIDPWSESQRRNQSMKAFDSVALYVNDDAPSVAGDTVQPGDEQKRIALNIPHGHLIHGVNKLYYKVTRGSGNVERSRDLLVLYHLRAPGNLALVIPADVVANGVSAARAAQGVVFGFRYTTLQAYDVVRFRIGNESLTKEVSDPQTPLTITLSTADFQKIGDGKVELDFVVTDQLGNSATSGVQTLDIHLAEVELSPPTLVKPAVDPIDVLNHKNGVTIRIDYPGAQSGDRARLIEVKPPAGATPFPLVQFNTNNRVNTVLTQAYLAARQGKEILFRWNLNRDGKPVGKSPVLNVRVLKIADGDPRLPVPIIEPADSFSVIDLNEFTTTPLVIFNDWPFSGGGYTVDVNVVGIDQNGDSYTIPVTTRISLSQEEERSGFSRPASRQQLNLLQDGSSVHVETTVYFNAEMLRFANSRPYTIKINRTPILSENFDSYPTKVLALGGKITLPSMTISFLTGTGYMGITALSSIGPISGGPFYPIANQSSGQILEMHISGSGKTQIMHIQFNWGYSRVRCYCRFAQFSNIPVAFFDSNKKLIERKYLSDTAPPQLVEGNSHENNIWSMTVTTPQMDLIAFDYFSMERK
ncbi:hypothetical protein [Pseudomonas sp. RIT288]|jgi:hypothetical protein|uniref:hypothetical protein n=1 Tax=Pseudomonas sp. RIT288 TaxID=1470589 RepID=UPI00044AA5AE|nr:hypothetical protein [Pseudomonas sp. RIT288]EZP32770.1 hypothetical protein BW33_01633 [Pseudomonas sp. RIT288]